MEGRKEVYDACGGYGVIRCLGKGKGRRLNGSTNRCPVVYSSTVVGTMGYVAWLIQETKWGCYNWHDGREKKKYRSMKVGSVGHGQARGGERKGLYFFLSDIGSYHNNDIDDDDRDQDHDHAGYH